MSDLAPCRPAGKGFAIGSAALVSLALFGAYVTRAKIDLIQSSILDPKVFSGGWTKVVAAAVVVLCHAGIAAVPATALGKAFCPTALLVGPCWSAPAGRLPYYAPASRPP